MMCFKTFKDNDDECDDKHGDDTQGDDTRTAVTQGDNKSLAINIDVTQRGDTHLISISHVSYDARYVWTVCILVPFGEAVTLLES